MGRNIDKGMWCKDEDGRLGIAHTDDVFGKDGKVLLNADGSKKQEPTFHIVNDRGETTLTAYRSWGGLTQCTYNEIPEPRREGLSRDYAANQLGYV